MANNDTDAARVIDGESGSTRRLEPKTGPVKYSKADMNIPQREYAVDELDEVLKYDGGKSRAQALALGLPEKVKGNPLGCRCNEAFLVGATKPVGSHIEADYMCDVGYHNYMLFELIGFEQKPQTELKIGPNGDLIEDIEEETKELGDY